MSVSQILSGTPAAVSVAATVVDVPATTDSFLGPTSFQNQPISGVLAMSGGDAGGLSISATAGPLQLTAPSAGGNVILTHDTTGTVTIEPDVSPPSAGGGANLTLQTLGAPDSARWVHFATGNAGGGLNLNEYTIWGYAGAGFGKPTIRMLSPYATASSGTGVTDLNPGFLDATRTGEIVGTGVAQVVPVTTILAGSEVHLIPVAGAAFPALVPAAPVITSCAIGNAAPAAGSFSVILPAGTTYRYYVFG